MFNTEGKGFLILTMTGFLVVCSFCLLLGCRSNAVPKTSAQTTCINRLSDLPKDWQPSNALRAKLSDAPWKANEQRAADQAVWVGLEEMINYQSQHPDTITTLWDNSVEAYLDTAYAADNMPKLKQRALATARRHLLILAEPFQRDGNAQCDEVATYLTLVIYADALISRMRADDQLLKLETALVSKTNDALADCETLKAMFGYHYPDFLASPKTANGDVYDMVMWSILLLDALSIESLKLPLNAETFIGELWHYLGDYPIADATEFKDGANHETFYDNAYLMTHVGYIPTGYGRYSLSVDIAPWLYRFLRANFYAVMEMGELDLTAEFVDLFRQYGCNEDNDRQLRDGSRYLLKLYEQAGQRWMDYREPYETEACNPYDLMHKPWTAIAGLRQRKFEPIVGGNYGEIAHRLLGLQRMPNQDAPTKQ